MVKAERQKNDSLVYLVHDLKTPLTSVLGYLRLIEDEEKLTPEMVKKYSGVARKRILKMLAEADLEYADWSGVSDVIRGILMGDGNLYQNNNL